MKLVYRDIAEREFEKRYKFASEQCRIALNEVHALETKLNQLQKALQEKKNEAEDWRSVMVAMNYAKLAIAEYNEAKE